MTLLRSPGPERTHKTERAHLFGSTRSGLRIGTPRGRSNMTRNSLLTFPALLAVACLGLGCPADDRDPAILSGGDGTGIKVGILFNFDKTLLASTNKFGVKLTT